MKKKGFTLVELLAVIIILAVIALIAIPIVLNVVESSRKSAFESGVYGVIETIELEVADKMLKQESLISEYNFPTEELEFQGEQPTGGMAKTDRKGKVSIAVHNGKWCAIKGYDEGTLTILEYEERTCILKETEIYYYGFIEDGEYTVDLNGTITQYNGIDTELVIPESFSGESYYKIINYAGCQDIYAAENPSATEEELEMYCNFPDAENILKENDLIVPKFGYIEYHNVEIDYDRCDTVIEIYNNSEQELENAIFDCSLNSLAAYGFTMEQLYQLGIITADRYIVNNYEIEELNGTETFEYVLDKDKCISMFNPEGTLSEEASLIYCDVEVYESDEETKNGFITSGLITEVNGYYKFKNIRFNKDKCVSIVTELGFPSSEASTGCSYDALIDNEYSINIMYETGIVTAEREVGYFEEDVVVEQHHYELNYEACKKFMKRQDSELTDDEALLVCINADLEIQTMDISELRGEYLETFNQLTQAGLLNKVSTVFAIKNVSVNEDECRNLATMVEIDETEISNLCTGNNLLSAGYPYKFLYEQGVISGEVMDINSPIEMKENDINKTVNPTILGYMLFAQKGITSVKFPSSVETIGTGAFGGNSLSGELDLSNTKVTTIGGLAFYGNKITSIKLPSSVETIGACAFAWNSISGELDLSDLTNLTTIEEYAFYENQITSVKFPSSVEIIGDSAFSWNSISGELDLSHTNLKEIGKSAFSRNQITSIKLPTSVETIDSWAFGYNDIIGELDLSNTKVIEIGSSAFYSNEIESIKLPSSVETIGFDAFLKRNNPSSNPNLVSIINPSGNVFDWSSITNSDTPDQSFSTGTITHENGNIEVKAE